MKWTMLFVFLGFFFIGCTSTGIQKARTITVSDRIDLIQAKSDAQDASLNQIKEDISNFSAKVTKESKSELSVKDVQMALKREGFYQGKVDGVLGFQTQKAIRNFLKDKGVKIDGKVRSETFKYFQKYLGLTNSMVPAAIQ